MSDTTQSITSADATLHLDTQGVRVGIDRTAYGEHAEPIFTTSSFVFSSAAEAARRFAGEEEGYIYSRFSNPTVAMFQNRLAAMEGGEKCIATASGMSAILATVLSLMQQGDHLVASRSMFGSTVNLFEKLLPRMGMSVSWVSLTDADSWEQAITPATRMFYLESPTNPLTEIADIKSIGEIAHAHGIQFVVDNCFCTPALQRPIELGADIIIHSATKYIDGQGRCVGGAIVGLSELLDDTFYGYMRSAGPSMSPFNAWVFAKGLETLSLRMQRHSETALRLAQWLESHPLVERVYYPGLTSHPQHELAKTQQSNFGGVVSFEIKGGQEQAWRFVDGASLMSITANLGDAKTTLTHPSTTTHGRMSEEDRKRAGVKPGLLRIAAGLEFCDDIIADIERAFCASCRA